MTKPSNSTPGVSAWAPSVNRPIPLPAPDLDTFNLLEQLRDEARKINGVPASDLAIECWPLRVVL